MYRIRRASLYGYSRQTCSFKVPTLLAHAFTINVHRLITHRIPSVLQLIEPIRSLPLERLMAGIDRVSNPAF